MQYLKTTNQRLDLQINFIDQLNNFIQFQYTIEMGNYGSTNEQQIREAIKQDYQIEVIPYLRHKRTQQFCTLHKITTNSHLQTQKIFQIIQEYRQSKCQSISKLRTHYFLNNSGYCSDEQIFYLIFHGQNNYTLKEQFFKRKQYQSVFSEYEITQIMETYLCGLRQYNHRFQREYQGLSLSSIVIDQQTSKMHLKDAWLNQNQQNRNSKLLSTYPSPQKLTSQTSKMDVYNQFLSNLFSLGVIALELNRLQITENIYLPKKKEVNYHQTKARIAAFKDQKLRKGVELLLEIEPSARKKIYQIWELQNKEQHFLKQNRARQQQRVEYQTSKPQPLNMVRQLPKQNLAQPYKMTLPTNPITKTNYNPVKQESKYHFNQPNLIRRTQQNPIRFNSQPQPFQPIHQPIPQNVNYHPNRNYDNSHSGYTLIGNQNNKTNLHRDVSLSFKDFLNTFQTNQHLENQNRRLQLKYEQKQLPNPFQPNRIEPTISYSLATPVQSAVLVNPKPSSGSPYNMFKQGLSSDIPSYKASVDYVREQTYKAQSQSPVKSERQIKSIIVENKKTNNQVGNIMEEKQKIEISPIQQDYNDHTFKISDHILDKGKKQSQQQTKAQDWKIEEFLLKYSKQETKPDILKPPQNKNQYNPTIVQVKDQDSPNQSINSQQILQDEYVVQEYETGSRYEGFKSNGMRNGRGKFYYQDGGYYQGEWKNNKMDGYGKLYYQGGKLAYEGNWNKDEFNGFGKVYNDNPSILSEPFDYTNFDFLEDYWEYYEGMLMKDTKEGRGKIKLSNGEEFEGDFSKDRIQGFGKYCTMHGVNIQGIWRDSKLIKIINNNVN